MNLDTAKNEYAEMVSNATHAFRRALRNEKKGHTDAADINWRSGIYWQAQSTRANLQTALALHA